MTTSTIKIHRNTYIIYGAALLLAAFTACNRPSWHDCEGMVWHTTYHITYESPVNLDDSILAVTAMVEKSLSPFDPLSTVSRINRGDTTALADSLLRRVFDTSILVNRHSGGAFDPTVSPLVNIWGYGYKKDNPITPTQQAIDSLLPLVGIAQCHISPDGHMRKAHPGTEFNFSAITKGYGCDLVGEMLRRNGCNNYMVEIGGEIALAGRSPRGAQWRVMIDAPIECDTAVVHERMAVISLTGCGIATSGNYRNYRDTPTGRTWHTISPANGRPALTDILSATVIAPTCMEADAWATACMAMGSTQAIKMIEAAPGVEALLATRDTILSTHGFPTLQ